MKEHQHKCRNIRNSISSRVVQMRKMLVQQTQRGLLIELQQPGIISPFRHHCSSMECLTVVNPE